MSDCPRCGAKNFRFACERCSLLTPAAIDALSTILETAQQTNSIITERQVRAALEVRGTFNPDDVEGILRALRLAQPRQGLSFPLWDRLRVMWHRWRPAHRERL